MSVAILSGVHLVTRNTAASVRVWNYAKALRMAGEVVYILSYEDYRHRDLLEIAPGIFAFAGKKRERGTRAEFFAMLSSLRCEKGLSGIIFYPALNPIFEIYFLHWKKKNTFDNVICEVNEVRRYELTYFKSLSLPIRVLYRWFVSYSERLIRCYKGAVCISDNIREYISPYNTNTIVVPILSNTPNVLCERKERHDGKLRFVFTGTVAIEKENLIELLKGFYYFDKEYRHWELLLYGNVPTDNGVRLRNYLESYGLLEKVKLMGEVQHEMISTVLASADCLILPRRNTKQNYYGFSTKLSEYAVSGTPIIMTDTGVVFNYFKDDYDCLKVDGYEASGFYEQFIKFVNTPQEKRNKIGQHAYETAKKYFDWRNYSKELSDFISE